METELKNNIEAEDFVLYKGEVNFEALEYAKKVREDIESGNIPKETKLTGDQRKQQLSSAMSHGKSKFAQEARSVTMKQRREMIKSQKTIREGFNCLIIYPKGKINKSNIPPNNVQCFFEEKLGFEPTIEKYPDLEIGDWIGGNIIVVYTEVPNKMPFNKESMILLDKKIRGPIIIYSEKVTLEIKYLQELLEDLKKADA